MPCMAFSSHPGIYILLYFFLYPSLSPLFPCFLITYCASGSVKFIPVKSITHYLFSSHSHLSIHFNQPPPSAPLPWVCSHWGQSSPHITKPSSHLSGSYFIGPLHWMDCVTWSFLKRTSPFGICLHHSSAWTTLTIPSLSLLNFWLPMECVFSTLLSLAPSLFATILSSMPGFWL